LFNVGSEPLGLIGARPVKTMLPDGNAIDLPWRT
jgi:hypothetical protein